MCQVTTYDAKKPTQNMTGSGTHIFDEGVNPFLDHFYTKIIERMVYMGTACKKRAEKQQKLSKINKIQSKKNDYQKKKQFDGKI